MALVLLRQDLVMGSRDSRGQPMVFLGVVLISLCVAFLLFPLHTKHPGSRREQRVCITSHFMTKVSDSDLFKNVLCPLFIIDFINVSDQ